MLFALRLKKNMHVKAIIGRLSKLVVNNKGVIRINNLGVLRVGNKRLLILKLDREDTLKEDKTLEIIRHAYSMLTLNLESIEQFIKMSVTVKLKKCKYGKELFESFVSNYNEKYKNQKDASDAMIISNIEYSDFKDSLTYTLKICLDDVRNIEHLRNLVNDLEKSTYVSRVTL